ncbi:hypothetical protein ACSBR1_038764 [Camellia fascicularis]
MKTKAPSKRFRSSIEDSDLNSIEDSDRSSIERFRESVISRSSDLNFNLSATNLERYLQISIYRRINKSEEDIPVPPLFQSVALWEIESTQDSLPATTRELIVLLVLHLRLFGNGGIDDKVLIEIFLEGGSEFTSIVLDVGSGFDCQPVALLPTEVELQFHGSADVNEKDAIFNYRRKYLPIQQISGMEQTSFLFQQAS